MRGPRFFSKRYLRISLQLLLILSLVIPFAHASTYVGYGSANLGSSTCGTNCAGASATTSGTGAALLAPLSGQLVSVSLFTGNSVPNQVVIMSFVGTTPATTGQPCTGGATCPSVNNGQSFTVLDVETLTGLSASAFNTITLAAAQTVTQGNWYGVLFMRTSATGTYVMLCGTQCGSNGGSSIVSQVDDLGITFGTTAPVTGTSYSTSVGDSSTGEMIGGTFQATATASGATVTVTQCYGNCGSPAITLVNTNSSHTINFNQTITYFYEFQSNINGFLLNVTTNVAKTYGIGGVFPNFMNLGVYTINNCPAGQTPFSPQCPGLLQRQQAFGTNGILAKGKQSMAGLGQTIPVSNGQWVGIGVSGAFSGLDLNDTNTNVNIFSSNEGKVPPQIAQGISQGNSKIGLWAWVIGNIVTVQPPTNPNQSCQSFATIDCWLPALVGGFCSNQSQSCTTSSALFWIMILTVIFEITAATTLHSIDPGVKIPFGEMFMFFFLIWTFIMTGLALLVLWVPVFFFMIAAIIFSKNTGRYF